MSSYSSYNTYSNAREYYYNPYNYSTYYPAVDGTTTRFYYVDGETETERRSKSEIARRVLIMVNFVVGIVNFVSPVQIPVIGSSPTVGIAAIE
ncbi:unnamed protein product [Adineta steineri]|uniref:Uncharacterized protein n=1 Tax=Adineta steineri TaxID=433720 RepID=A0A815UN58_9BILA|nr:unnamed protein product [Adineta steineri]CAF1317767.1 unnamed protein product [Adineta steineri]CAF1518348.1 unnamed protein product [Adineta steineri]CAF3925860.1 unnamed protein product [Adineta steineri]CAF4013214.1 unnamed protein product [Adineta steineri]